MEYTLILTLLVVLYLVLKFFRLAAERRKRIEETYKQREASPDENYINFVCVRLTDGSSASYFRPKE